MSDLGRQVKYGLGVESTPGVAVAPTNWANQLSFELNPMSEYAQNTSAWGNIIRTNSATLMRQYAEGSLEAKLTSDFAGYIILGAMGSVSSAANADASGLVYDHTFNVNEDIDGQSFTLVRQDSLATKAHALARFGEWAMSMKLDDYITYTANVLAKIGAATTATAAFIEEAEFVAKHFNVKTAASLAGIAGATNQSTVESFDLKVNPNLEADWEAGNSGPFGFSSRGYELSFEMTCRYDDTSFEDAYNNGTTLAMQMTAENTDVTIGTAAHPKLVVTAPRFNITDWVRNEEKDSPITQTFTGTIHFSPTEAYAIRKVLTNTTPNYV